MSLLMAMKSKASTPSLGPISCAVQTGFGETVTRTTFTFTNMSLGTPDPNRYIIVAIHARHGSGTGPQMTAASIAGVALTKLAEHRDTSGNLSISSLWGAYIPTGTTGTLTVTFSASINRCMGRVFSVFNITSLSPFATKLGQSGNVSPLNLDIPVAANSILIATAHNNNSSSTTTWTGVDEQYDTNGVGCHSGGSRVFASALALQTVRATFTGTIDRTSGCSIVLT